MTHATNERRPALAGAGLRGSRAASKKNHRKGTAKGVESRSSNGPVPTRLEWAGALIDAADGPVPAYGSPEWEALPDDSRTKVAATVIAAECWRTYTDPAEVAMRLRIEVDALRAEEEAPGLWSQDVVDAVHRTALQPSHAALSRLRGEPEAEARANVHRRRMGLPVDERPSTKCDGDQHDWAVFTITTDWPQDADQPQQWRCRRCLLFGRPAPKLRLVAGG